MIEMPLAEYLSDPCAEPSLDSSTAWALITKSPLHAWSAHSRLNPAREPDDANSAMDIGAAAHSCFLEDDSSRITVIHFDDWRKKEAREQRDEAHAAGLVPLLAHQWEQVSKIVDASRTAVSFCDEISGVFDGATVEQVCTWQEGDTWCRARPDLLSGDRRILLNYKTTGASAAPARFGAMMVRDGYHVQAYHHAKGIAAETGEMPTCLWLAQETEPPYAASVLGASPALMELAALQWKHALSIWRECRRTNEWPAYPSRVCWVEPKAWEIEQWSMRPDVATADGTECRCWKPDRTLCGSREGVELIDDFPACASCRKDLRGSVSAATTLTVAQPCRLSQGRVEKSRRSDDGY